MLKHVGWSLAVVWTFAALTACAADGAQAEKVFRWKLKPGETLKYHMVQDMAQNIRAGENQPPIALSTKMAMDLVWKIDAVDDQGVISLDQTIERIQVKLQSAQGVMLEFDSAAAKEPEGMAKMIAPVFEAMVKKPFRVKMTSRGELKEVKLPQGMLESMTKTAGIQMGNLVSEDSMKQFGLMSVFPEGPVAPGKTWTQETTMKNPVTGNQVVKTTFRYEGPETRDGKTLDKIALMMNFQPEGKKQEGEKKEGEKKEAEKTEAMASLTTSEAKGFLSFDNEAGRVVETTMEMKMKIDMNVMGQKITQDMNIKMHMTPQPAAQEK